MSKIVTIDELFGQTAVSGASSGPPPTRHLRFGGLCPEWCVRGQCGSESSPVLHHKVGQSLNSHVYTSVVSCPRLLLEVKKLIINPAEHREMGSSKKDRPPRIRGSAVRAGARPSLAVSVKCSSAKLPHTSIPLGKHRIDMYPQNIQSRDGGTGQWAYDFFR